MNKYPIGQTRFDKEMAAFGYNWGNVANLSDQAIEELGIAGAFAERNVASPRRTSSGETNTMSRKERQEHYKRKAVLEREKEATRRQMWARRHPGASESNWRRREEARKTRKARERAERRAMRKGTRRRTSSKRA